MSVPLGTLATSGTLVNDGITLLYRGSTRDVPCPLKAQYCPNTPTRKIPRSIYQHARDVVRSLSGTTAFEPRSGSCLEGRRRFASQFATTAGGVNLAAGVLAGLVAGRVDIFAAPR